MKTNMRKIFGVIACGVIALMLMTSCENGSLNGNVERPSWAPAASTDMTSSMTAVVKVDLEAQYPGKAKEFVLDKNDLVAAFSGETCLGVASPNDGLFFLYIAGPTGPVLDERQTTNITLRYYSTFYKNLFEAVDVFPFVNDDNKGTADTPLIPPFVVVR
jgi:hypothetical protein